MSTIDQGVPVIFQLPRAVYERVNQVATAEQTPVEEVLRLLVSEGLEVHATSRQLWEGVSEQYRARLGLDGNLPQSPDRVLEDLRLLREQIASELYP